MPYKFCTTFVTFYCLQCVKLIYAYNYAFNKYNVHSFKVNGYSVEYKCIYYIIIELTNITLNKTNFTNTSKWGLKCKIF